MKTLNQKERASFVERVTSLGAHGGEVLAVSHGGASIDDETRNRLLADVREGKHVAIQLRVRAYEQEEGKSNRNFVRFMPAALKQLAATSKGMPFIRDHQQRDSMSRGGSLIAGVLEEQGKKTVLYQDATITAPWAVELALRNLLSGVSIGWWPSGPINCSLCKAPVFSRCWHFPGDRFAEFVGDDGKKRLGRNANGDIVIEWIYTAVQLVETSIVVVGAVTGARIEEIRSAMSAVLGVALDATESALGARKEDQMLEGLAKILGLAASAGDAEIEAAAEKNVKELAGARIELAIAAADRKELAIVKAELAVLAKTQRDGERAEYLRAGVASGRIRPSRDAAGNVLAGGDEDIFGALFDLDPGRAKERMAARAEQSATPVGTPPQSDAAAALKANGTDVVATYLAENGGLSKQEMEARLAASGVSDPAAALLRFATARQKGLVA